MIFARRANVYDVSAAVQPTFPCRPHIAFRQSGSLCPPTQEHINPATANLRRNPFAAHCSLPLSLHDAAVGPNTTNSQIPPRGLRYTD